MVTQAGDEGAGVRRSRGARAVPRARRARGTALGFGCLPSKLRPPRAHVALVAREELVTTLLKSTEPLVVVSAPAGSGKTVTLTQWLGAESRPAIWLRLDGADNDPLALLRCLTVALHQVLAIDQEILELLRQRHPPLADRVLPGLAAAVAAAPPFVLVLDDAQLVENQQAWAHVGLALENLPEGAQMVVASRVDPPLPLGKLRARGELLEVRFEELAFDQAEALALLRLHAVGEGGASAGEGDAGPACGPGAVAALLEATEGWATGLYLASLTAKGRSPDEWLPEVRGDQRAIAGYLLDEVLARQPADLQRFLLETAILDELTAPLCAAVTGRADAGAVLARLARENLFVSALDERDERFRYHHLFADLLRARLKRLEPERTDDLQRRAAAWHEAHGELEPAIRHYLAAGDVAATVGLTPTIVETLGNAGLVETPRRILSLYTEEQLLTHPDLAIAAGWYYTTAGGTRDEETHWTRIMTHYRFDDGPTATSAASLRSSWLILIGVIMPHGLSEMRRLCEEALRLEPQPGDWRAFAESNLAYCYYLAGASERAARVWRDSLRGRPYAGTLMEDDFSTWNLAMVAHIAEDDGRWDEAAELLTEVERRRPSMGLDQEPHPHWLPHLLARLRLMSHQGDPDTIAFVRLIDDFARPMVGQTASGILVVGVLLGEVALEQGDVVTARRWCDEALGALAEWPDAGVFGKRAKALKDALERRVMAEPITPAEQRVLELLPTRLTVAHLADRLFLSQPTVKAHLRAIYRKLEVGTREAAVERARELGLLKR